MIVKFEREGLNDETFVINWPDSQLRFHLIRRGDKLDSIKEAVYVLMDKFRTEFYIGETSDLMSRFRTHRWQRDFWHCALVIEDRNEEFKKQDVRKWFEWRLFQIATERSRADKKYKIDSSAGKQADKSYLENRVNDILAVCRFLGIPWGYPSESRKTKPCPLVPEDDSVSQSPGNGVRHPAPSFTFAMAHIPENADLIFIEGGQKVKAKGKNRIEFVGQTYSLTGFVRKFIPPSKRNKKDAYQGPAFFTYKGELLTALRKKYETTKPSAATEKSPKGVKELCVTGLTKTQLAKKIATRVDGRDGAFGGILQYFSQFKRCPKTGKWRKPLSDAGISFDKNDFVIDWRVAQI